VQAGKIPWSKFINILVNVIKTKTKVGGFFGTSFYRLGKISDELLGVNAED
jgi:hypothetical protein